MPQRQLGEDLVRKMKEAGLDKAVTFPFPFTSYFDLETANERRLSASSDMKYPYEDQNKYVLECAEKYDPLIPFLAICLGMHDNYEHIEFLVKQNTRIRGLKLHSRVSRSPIKELVGSRFMKLAQDHGLSLMIHTDSENIHIPTLDFDLMEFSNPMHIVELADKYPDVNIAGAHLGWLSRKFLDEVYKRENAFVDTSPFLLLCSFPWRANDALQINYKDPYEAFREVCSKYTDSILWGSDEPYTQIASNTLKDEKRLLDSLEDKLKLKISQDNIRTYLHGYP
jgi:predicted TIM-barrel fold metal-dependent hydrolase